MYFFQVQTACFFYLQVCEISYAYLQLQYLHASTLRPFCVLASIKKSYAYLQVLKTSYAYLTVIFKKNYSNFKLCTQLKNCKIHLLIHKLINIVQLCSTLFNIVQLCNMIILFTCMTWDNRIAQNYHLSGHDSLLGM